MIVYHEILTYMPKQSSTREQHSVWCVISRISATCGYPGVPFSSREVMGYLHPMSLSFIVPEHGRHGTS